MASRTSPGRRRARTVGEDTDTPENVDVQTSDNADPPQHTGTRPQTAP